MITFLVLGIFVFSALVFIGIIAAALYFYNKKVGASSLETKREFPLLPVSPPSDNNQERKQREQKEQREREQREKELQEREQREREQREREQREKEQREKEQREKEQREKEQREREQRERKQQEKEQREKEQREREQREREYIEAFHAKIKPMGENLAPKYKKFWEIMIGAMDAYVLAESLAEYQMLRTCPLVQHTMSNKYMSQKEKKEQLEYYSAKMNNFACEVHKALSTAQDNGTNPRRAIRELLEEFSQIFDELSFASPRGGKDAILFYFLEYLLRHDAEHSKIWKLFNLFTYVRYSKASGILYRAVEPQGKLYTWQQAFAEGLRIPAHIKISKYQSSGLCHDSQTGGYNTGISTSERFDVAKEWRGKNGYILILDYPQDADGIDVDITSTANKIPMYRQIKEVKIIKSVDPGHIIGAITYETDGEGKVQEVFHKNPNYQPKAHESPINSLEDIDELKLTRTNNKRELDRLTEKAKEERLLLPFNDKEQRKLTDLIKKSRLMETDKVALATQLNKINRKEFIDCLAKIRQEPKYQMPMIVNMTRPGNAKYNISVYYLEKILYVAEGSWQENIDNGKKHKFVSLPPTVSCF